MRCRYSRRSFVKGALAAGGMAAALSCEERALMARDPDGGAAADAAGAAGPREPVKPGAKGSLPTGKIGELQISRLIMGGNLIAGFAHSRDLMYVSKLLKAYFTEEKIFETLRLGEEHGINCINTNPHAGKVIPAYRKAFGSGITWIVQGYPSRKHGMEGIKRSVDAGADAIYVQGNIADRLVAAGDVEFLGQAVRFIQAQGLPAGVGGHSLAVPKACEAAGLEPDFYVKTLHTDDYFTARRPEQTRSVVENRDDNYWCTDAAGTIEFMRTIKRPWIAYKVLAAGAIHPRKALPYVFRGGADFALVGMFDFQIAEDVRLANAALKRVTRRREWMG